MKTATDSQREHLEAYDDDEDQLTKNAWKRAPATPEEAALWDAKKQIRRATIHTRRTLEVIRLLCFQPNTSTEKLAVHQVATAATIRKRLESAPRLGITITRRQEGHTHLWAVPDAEALLPRIQAWLDLSARQQERDPRPRFDKHTEPGNVE